ncbi:MAG: bifunctional phosphopantothenoylcysteine decarboxylase/phosphopantothenate--cysteine ligase CoaBC [Lachnospiraceae bacterium]|nr:bifunctional phosphopantothenoylcysteine decarboxylase/phosphopantothenate--cysteine ligase CoaBC [Lachnospiraceae bacterium]
MDLKGKHVLLGVSGGIAAYKIASLASALKKQGADVTVLMTKNACEFITPLTFETLTGNKCLIDTFDRNFEFSVEHVSVAQSADVILVAPATANIIAKLAHGIADDMLTTTYLACTCPKLVSPSMNTRMYKNPVTQDNIETLRRYGTQVILPDSGYLACGDTGEGRMPDPSVLQQHIEYALTEKDLAGKKILVTAGPTQEALDPVRFLSNHSSGKMGYRIAERAAMRGAEVTLVSGKTALDTPLFVKKINVTSAEEMAEAVLDNAAEQDIIIKAAAVADYRPKTVADEKIKKKDDDLYIPLERTRDIPKTLGENKKPGQFLCGFSMETEHMEENAREKLVKKNLDLIVANNVKTEGAGFAVDTNVVKLIGHDETVALPLLDKAEVADRLLSHILHKITGTAE